MRIQHNIMAMNSYRNYTNNTSALAKNLEKLSSGYKINRAGDDAAGLAISEKMRAQITGLKQAQANAKSGINLVQTAEGALTEVHDMLNRMVKLADQSANGTYDDKVDRNNLQKEVAALKTEINRIADASNFNGIKLLDGSMGGPKTEFDVGAVDAKAKLTIDFTGKTGADLIGGTMKLGEKTYEFVKTGGSATGTNTAIEVDADAKADAIATKVANKVTTGLANYDAAAPSGNTVTLTATDVGVKADATPTFDNMGLTLQIGDTSDSFNQLTVSIQSMKTDSLGIADVSVANKVDAAAAVDKIKTAINTVSSVRGDLGATQNRLEHTINNLSVMTENIQDAEATIRDVDVAEEMMAYTKNNILVQSAQAMLAQANQVPQGVLQLLQ